MTALLFGLIYLSLAVSAIACVVRAVRYARLPINLRWELYPVPHEAAEHTRHGGSYFEDVNWWTRPAHSNRLGELKAMSAEILFLQAMYRHNRKLWRWSYLFHLGLYVLIATLAAALIAAAMSLTPAVIPFAGILGCILVMTGTAGLLIQRTTDPKLRNYSAPMDYFNLGVFFATCAMLVISSATAPGPGLIAITKGLLTFNTSLDLTVMQSAAMAMSALLIAYIPMTHMSHFIGKYFMYHSIRWGDKPALRDPSLEAIAGYLTYRPAWLAPHIDADGVKSWADIVSRNPSVEKSK